MPFRLLTSVMYKLRRRFTPNGLALGVVLLLSIFIGIDTYRTLTYQVFTLLAALFGISFLFCFFFRARITAYRKLPRFGTVGEKLEYGVVVKNFSEQVQEGLLVIENFTREWNTREAASNGSGKKDDDVIHSQKKSSRKQKKIRLQKESKEVPLARLLPRSETEVRISIVPTSRGKLTLENLIIACPDLFNLMKSFHIIPKTQDVLILPKRYPIPPLNLPGRRRYQSGGVALTHSVGDSEEFASMRDYRPGDPLRRIHWPSWAKTGKPIVKEYEEEFFVRHALILDTFKKDVEDAVFEEAVSVAASFVFTVQTQESLLDLLFVGANAYCFTSGRGLNSTDKLLEILAALGPCPDKHFATLSALVQSRTSLLSGCICILLDWDPERKQLVTLLRNMRIPLKVFVMTGADGPPTSPAEGGYDIHYLKAGKSEESLADL